MFKFTFSLLVLALAHFSEALPTAHNSLTVFRRDGPTDAQVLNFALTLEHLEDAFYKHSVAKFSSEDFMNAGYKDWARPRYQQIAEHEATHVDFLQIALKTAGATAVQPCQYSFSDKTVQDFVKLSAAFETTGTSAYTGAAQFVENKGYLTVAAAILATEARHSAWINSAISKQNPWSTSFEVPITFNQAYSIASQFIKSCPPSNTALLPPGTHAYPVLKFSGALVPGQSAELSWPDSDKKQDRTIYVAFQTGVDTYLAEIGNSQEEGVKRFTVPTELKSRGTVFASVVKDKTVADENIVAGTALVMFPFDSNNNPV